MAQSGYTPLLIYSSSTASTAPSASNLTNSSLGSELAVNITDGKLYYKDNSGVVQVIASKAGNSGTFSSVTITGGTINNTTIGATTAANGTFSNLYISGLTSNNILFGGASNIVSQSSSLQFINSKVVIGANNYTAFQNVLGYGLQGTYWTLWGVTDATSASLQLQNNLSYGSGSYKYTNSTSCGANQIYMNNGSMTFYCAVPGVNPNPVTLTNALTFSSYGSWGLGATPSFGTSGQYIISNGSSAVPSWATFPITTPFTTNGVLYASSTSNATTGTALQFNGTNILSVARTTPSSYTNFAVLELGNAGSYVGSKTTTTNTNMEVGSNLVTNGTTYTYAQSNGASLYRQAAGQHDFYVVSSGTAGNTATLSSAMTIFANKSIGFDGFSGGTIGQVLSSTGNSSAPQWSNTVTLNGVTTGGGLRVSNLIPIGTTTISNSGTYSFLAAADGLIVFYVSAGNSSTSEGVFCITTSASSTIQFVNTPSNIVNSNSPTANQLGIYKTAGNTTISFTVGSTYATNITNIIKVTVISGGVS